MADDVKDILSINKRETVMPKANKPVAKETKKRPDGMHRELFSLTGGGSTIIPARKSSLFRDKKNISTKAAQWVLEEFSNPARGDSLKLTHWQRAEDVDEEYPFAKYNKKVDLIKFSDDEYEIYLKDIDPNWSKKETLILWELLERFDLRFIIVADHYPEEYNRTVEELKARFYSVCKAYLEAKNETSHPLAKVNYNIDYERQRKTHLERLMLRSKEQDDEEKQLLEEAKKLEQKIKKEEKEQKNLQKIKKEEKEQKNLQKIKKEEKEQKNLQKIKKEEKEQKNLQKIKKEEKEQKNLQKIKKEEKEQKNLQRLLRDDPENMPSSLSKRKGQSNLYVNTSLARGTHGHSSSPVTSPGGRGGRRDRGSGAYLRSSRLKAKMPISDRMNQKLTFVLSELNIPEDLLPTANVLNVYEKLKKECLTFLSLQKYNTKKEHEKRLLEEKLRELKTAKRPAQAVSVQNKVPVGNSGMVAQVGPGNMMVGSQERGNYLQQQTGNHHREDMRGQPEKRKGSNIQGMDSQPIPKKQKMR
eukprot:CAMPEP_0115037732 /NCGR_PEP_ID=MMETSP0216-20121206/42988_1 /TAXON_ID=223996 /ORGANISM="Protocruzia adherens, Strain Boccale" /LENGTH=528 /DNA_ID=CAMNT_0002417997 /DNA_START=29 /DNA_END=1615 /DNA_ORIENTATION=+